MTTRQNKSLHYACSKGWLRKVRETLEQGGDVLSMLDFRLGFLGYTPLHEAVCQGHEDILSLLLIYGGNVNALANGNYTPLHIAASLGHVKCIEVLLKNNANIKVLDDFHKTPYQTAVQHARKDCARCLKSAEIIRAAAENPQELQSLIDETSAKDITEKCFDEALIEASHVGNFEAIRMLLVAGAINIWDCIDISTRKRHYKVTVLLLICHATITENISMLESLLDDTCSYAYLKEFIEKSLPMETVVCKLRASLKNSKEDCTNVAIRLPGNSKSTNILKVLLSSTSCNRDTRKVNWSKLSLEKLHESLIDLLKSWVQYLNLSGNMLTYLPEKVIELKLVVRLNLSANRLKVIPSRIFSLICLRELDISDNAINELPDDVEWKPTLKSLNVGDNNLSALPASISQSRLETLNLSKNNFIRIPPCVCEIISLKDLDLSNNREISELPNEMGKLRNLAYLHLRNLDQITDPPERMRRNTETLPSATQDLIALLRTKLRSCERYFCMKLILVGKGCQGKTTLVRRLQNDFKYNDNDLTPGVEITDLLIRKHSILGGAFNKDFLFKVWDFGGQEDYYTTHQCFLSTMSLYLLVWRLTDGEEGVKGLTPWLDNIAVRSPGSTVIVVGTHLDCISSEKYGEGYVDHLKRMVNELVNIPRYKDKIIVPDRGICAVSCVPRARTEITTLRQIIYDTAANLKKGRNPIMGELIPCSFVSLIDRIEKRKLEMLSTKRPPIIRKEEFHAMVKQNAQLCKRDIEEPMDVRDATIFLRERGILMHFDDPNEGLNDLYFIDPRWLCELMARVVTVKSHADLVKDGILEVQKTKVLFRDDGLPFEFLPQYIRVLVTFQVAYLLDQSRILVPSKLPEEKPEQVENLSLHFAPVRRVYKIDYQKLHGFWPRFMSRFFFYMKEMIAVDPSRYQKSDDSEHGFSAKFCRSCVRTELVSGGTFPCFTDIADTSSGKDEVDNGAKRSDSAASSNGTPAPAPPQPAAGHRSPNDRGPLEPKPAANGSCGASFQALLLDPSVKIFCVDDLEGDSDDDDGGIVINNVDTGMAASSRFFTQRKKKSARDRPQTNVRIPSCDRSSCRPPAKTSKRKTPGTSQKTTDEDQIYRKTNANHATCNGDHPRTDETDAADGENRSTTNPRETTKNGFDREREEIGEDVVKNELLHKSPSVASSTSIESEQNDGDCSCSEQANRSSISSRTPSECSSSLMSAMDNLPESDLFSESGNTSPVQNLYSYHSTMFASVSTTGSVTNEDYKDIEGGSSYGQSQSDDSCVVSSASTGTHECHKECKDVCEGEGKLGGSPGIAVLNGTVEEASVGEPDVAHTELGKSRSNPGCDVMHNTADDTDNTTDVIDDVTEPSPETTANELGATCEVANPDAHVADTDVTGTDITGSQLFGTNPHTQLVTDTQSELSGVASEVVSDVTDAHSGHQFTSSTADQPSSPPGTYGNGIPANANDDSSSQMDDPTSVEHSKMPKREDDDFETEASDVRTELCTLCKNNVPARELVTIPLDVADLIQNGYLHCWRSGICLMHPNLFLLVSHRSFSDTFVVECAVSPSLLGRRLLTFVVDHLDTLIKEWYPGLLLSCGAGQAVEKLIPCRLCEKNGVAKPHRFTFDSCVTQYSMGNFVKCPRHEVSIQDIAPDVVLQDIDPELRLREDEIEYESIDANKIGSGGYGKVYRGRCRGKEAAIKEYSTPNGEDAMKRYSEVRTELNVLRRVGHHPYLVNFIGVCLRPFLLVLELAVEGSLGKTLFDSNFLIDRVVVYRIVYQVAEALSFLHSLKVIYRDLKPGNVLVMSYEEQDEVNIKLTDFGTATFQFSEGLFALEGTPGYHAPEMLKEFSERTGYDEKVDVFSLAMLIYGFVTRKRPFYNINSSAEINDMVISGCKPEYDDKNVMASRLGLVTLTWLMEKCWLYNPCARPSSSAVAAQVRSTPFQIFLGVVALPCPQSVRHVCVVEATRELWVAVDDKTTNMVLVYELNRMCLKRTFTINRRCPEDPPSCLQVNCMHVTSSAVLIGLRGDLDVVMFYDVRTYNLKENVSLSEPVFCMTSNDDYIFLGMSSGVFRILPRRSNNDERKTVEVSNSEPISCMLAVDKFLWLSVTKCIQIFNTVGAEGIRAFELNAIRFNSSNSSISHAVLSVDKTAVWSVSGGDSVVTGWDVEKRQKLCEFDCKSLLSGVSRAGKPLDMVEAIVTCILAALDTVWVGTGGGVILIVDGRSGELITWLRLFDDHVRALTLVLGPGPCTERCYAVVSGKNLHETALSRDGKVLCHLGQEVVKQAPRSATKELVKTKKKVRKSFRAKSPASESQKSDVEDGGMNSTTNGGLLLFFEVLPADMMRRVEARS